MDIIIFEAPDVFLDASTSFLWTDSTQSLCQRWPTLHFVMSERWSKAQSSPIIRGMFKFTSGIRWGSDERLLWSMVIHGVFSKSLTRFPILTVDLSVGSICCTHKFCATPGMGL